MLLPVLRGGLGWPGRAELGEVAERGIPVDTHLFRGTRRSLYSDRTQAAFYPPVSRGGRGFVPGLDPAR